MIIIAHRGNLGGPDSANENRPEQVERALSEGFDVEVDVWLLDRDTPALGHDEPLYPVTWDFLLRTSIWCHAKDLHALQELLALSLCRQPAHVFYHENDTATLTSKGWIWIYGTHFPGRDAVCVLPEQTGISPEDFPAVCTDFPKKYRGSFT